jgi:signal peptidase I
MLKEKIIDNLKTIIVALFLAVIIRSILLQPFYIPSSSMEKTLLVGDRLFVTKFSYGYSRHSFPFSIKIIPNRIFFSQPKRGDVIVFKTPSDNRTDYIKRLIGIPGDTIQFKDSDLYLNNKKLKKDFIKKTEVFCGDRLLEVNEFAEHLSENKTYNIFYATQNSMKNTDVYTIPNDHYFFLGDNRDCSKDSRFLTSVGYVHMDNLVGKAQFLFFSNDTKIANIFTFWKWHESIRFNRIFKKLI